MEQELIEYEKDSIICRQGEEDFDLYRVESGRLLVFVKDGTKIIPVAELGEKEFLGELSYFDQQTRSAYVITLGPTKLFKIPVESGKKTFPKWLHTMAKDLTSRIRHADELIATKGLKKKSKGKIKALSIEEQRNILKILGE